MWQSATGWLFGCRSQGSPREELRTSVADLLEDNPALQVFVTENCLERFLAARGHSVSKASQALRKTLLWRKEFRPDDIMFEEVSGCATGGRVELLQDLDKHRRPILMYRLRCPAKEGTTGEEYIRFWVHALECTSKLADDNGVGKAVAIFDMEGYSDARTVMPNFRTRVEAIRIAQAHYPERLGLSVVAHPPLLFWALWNSLKPFIDPVTKSKVFFANTKEDAHAALAPHVDGAVLYESLGGERPDTYDFRRYERFMRQLDGERRAQLSAAAVSSAKSLANGDAPIMADGNTLHANCHQG